MNCIDILPRLDAYCDGELDLTECLEIEQHLQGCPACATLRDIRLIASRQIRATARPAPAGLENRLRVAMTANPTRPHAALPRMKSWLAWAGGGIIAAVAIGFLLAQDFAHRTMEQGLINELTDSHIRSLVGGRLVDVISSDQHTVRPWFEGKVDFAPPVPDLSTNGFEIVGGRLEFIGGRTAAGLVYQRRKHFVTLFVWPEDGKSTPSPVAALEVKPAPRGYVAASWHSRGMNHWAISEINSTELAEFANAFARAEAGSGEPPAGRR